MLQLENEHGSYKLTLAFDFSSISQETFTCSNSTIATLEKIEICSKLAIKAPKRCHQCHSGVFAVNYELISHLFLVFFC